ncbi:Enhancer of polycomb homolog 1 [Galdieria sulphuraria]|nr:Enhancer of polycomb homolog 1 [Galdieria sulphuraria]
MSRPSFRPRPIDLNRPLQIIRSNKDFPVQEELFSTRGLPAVETGVDPSEQEERHLKEALLASLLKDDRRKHEIEIPIPVVQERKDPIYESQKPYHLPKEYVQEVKKDISSFLVLYEADELDEEFITRLNNDSEYQLSLSDFEYVMDMLERIQGSEDDLITSSKMREGLRSLREIPESIKEEIYQHWFQRRQEKEQPLLRILRKPPAADDPNPSLAFRPREHESGAQKGTENTYENYRKAVRMRRDFEKLRMIVEQVVKRERLKREHLSCSIVYSRLALARSSVKMAAVIKQSCMNDNNVLCIYDKRTASLNGSWNGTNIYIPLSGLALPSDVRKAVLAGRFMSDRSKKNRKRRRPEDTSKKDEEKEEEDRNTSRFDEYGFDEAGQRFVKNMRYFSGGFVVSGVNPYDFRVFEAAAQRNTVRYPPWNPQIVQLPDDVPFCSPIACPSPRDTRFRGRLGRGGRIIFDRVVDSSHGTVTPLEEGKGKLFTSSSNSFLLPDQATVNMEKLTSVDSSPRLLSVDNSMWLRWPSKKNGDCLENGTEEATESPKLIPDSCKWVTDA